MIRLLVGNYAVVELFVDQYPGSKTQKNKGGFTALQIAKRLNFNKIANLIERGERAAPDAPPEKKSDSIYDENFLVESVRCSRVDVIRKFIDQLYESKDEKIRICKKMIAAAELGNHYEMLKLLKDHYAVLNTELNSRQTPGGGGGDISLDKRFKQILLGFLGSLNNMITGSAIVLDPADPNTYTKYFSGLMLNAERRAEELVSVKDLDELRQLVEQSRAEAKEQLRTIEAALNDLDEKLIDLEDQLRDVNEQLANEKGANASERKKLIKTKDQLEKLLATHQCTKSLTEKKQTVATNCHQAIEFFKSDSNLIYFYKIVEERLKSLFIRYYSEQGGYVKGPISVVSKMIPISE